MGLRGTVDGGWCAVGRGGGGGWRWGHWLCAVAEWAWGWELTGDVGVGWQVGGQVGGRGEGFLGGGGGAGEAGWGGEGYSRQHLATGWGEVVASFVGMWAAAWGGVFGGGGNSKGLLS